jgi:hypothetical protein
MTTEAPKVEDIPAAIEGEVQSRTDAVAAVAAGQIDQAHKDAEAIARAAESTHLATRLQSIEEGNTQWREQMEAKLLTSQAETAAAIAASQQLILDKLSQSKPPETTQIVEALPAASVEQEPNSKQQDTTKEKTQSPQQRVRRVL